MSTEDSLGAIIRTLVTPWLDEEMRDEEAVSYRPAIRKTNGNNTSRAIISVVLVEASVGNVFLVVELSWLQVLVSACEA